MKIKTSITFLLVAVISAGTLSWEKSDPVNDYTNLYFQKINALEDSFNKLASLIRQSDLNNKSDIQTIKDQIAKNRIQLKGIDIWLRYLEPVSYKKLNGPLPVEWETEVFEKFERPYFRKGAGLNLAWQYIENISANKKVNGSTDTLINKDSLVDLITQSHDALVVFRADTVVKPLVSHDHFFLCNRLYILNLAAIYTTGFECPDQLAIIPELKKMMKDVKQVYALYNSAFPKFPLSEEYITLYEKTLQYANNQPSNFDQFDHFTFIKDYVNALFSLNQKMIKDYNVRSESYVDYSISDQCHSIFDKSLYRGQKTKGVYYLIEDDKILDNIRHTGKLLFYDPVFSKNNLRSCASCHVPLEYFTDTTMSTPLNFNRRDHLLRKAPSLINVIYNHLLMFDGKHISLRNQFKDVTSNPNEMASNEKEIMEKILSCKEYKDAFKKYLPYTKIEKEISFDQVISAVTLYYGEFSNYLSPFDEAMNGKTKEEIEVKNGFNLFMSKAKCGTCHFVPQFNGVKPPFISTEFEVLGVPEDTTYKKLSNDSGRYKINPAPQMLNAFRTGSLRNVAHTKPYAHNGIFSTLSQVIDFYDAGGGTGKGLSVLNQTLPGDSLHLTALEKKSLVLFMESLTEKISFEAPPEKLPISKNKELNLRLPGGVY